jgi:hypothetical protein
VFMYEGSSFAEDILELWLSFKEIVSIGVFNDAVESRFRPLLTVPLYDSKTVVNEINFIEDCILTSERFLELTDIIGEDDCWIGTWLRFILAVPVYDCNDVVKENDSIEDLMFNIELSFEVTVNIGELVCWIRLELLLTVSRSNCDNVVDDDKFEDNIMLILECSCEDAFNIGELEVGT